MHMTKFTEELKNLLKQDIVDLEQLKTLLEQEKHTLTTRNTDKINQLAKDKSQTVSQLEQRAKIKARLLAQSGLEIRPGQVEAKLQTLQDAELMDLWQHSREKLTLCQEQNAVNGSIIEQSRQRVNKIMMIVRGQNKTQHLYGQQGRTQAYNNSQRIGEA
jgi:flagellar biosynthesis/type III secretory pathway chaperone